MDERTWQNVKEKFIAALEIDADERPGFLAINPEYLLQNMLVIFAKISP